MRLRSISNVLTLATAAGSLVAAVPSGHKHHPNHHEHVEKREPEHVVTIDLPGPTTVVYQLNGKSMNEAEVCQGIEDGSLQLAEESNVSINCSDGAKAAPSPTPSTLASSVVATSVSSPLVTADTASAHTTIAEEQELKKKQVQPASATSDASSSVPTGQGLEKEFPDGTIDCSSFPSEYGPIAIEWAQLGGWSGIQHVTIEGNSVTQMSTANPGDSCKPGSMCSYACPPGYQKSQWPAAQGSTGQSVGGLSCNSDGKLALTNSALSKNLCIKGTGAAVVQNKLSENAAICRTDYPGTEAEVIPLNTEPDSSSNLTCPDANSYYTHEGDPTSAQYYINNQGVAVSNACTWGTDGSDMGNWAPSYLGVGQDTSGKTWLSISSTAQNNPSNYKALNYTVEITGDTSGKCRLNNGKYCSGDNYDDCNDSGCTVELMSGQGKYVLTDGSS